MTTDMHSVSRKPTVLRCTHIALLVFVYCCAWNCAADSTGSEDKAKSMSNPVSSLSKERVDERVGLILKRSGSNMNAMATSNLASTFFNPSELEKARQFCQQLGVDPYAQPFSSGIRFKKSPFDEEGIRYKKSSPFADEGIRYKKASPFAEEGIRYKKSPFDEEGIRYKKSPFDAEGIRFKKSPFDEEGIRYKKSSPFAEEGIRYKKSPFEAEGIRY